MGNIVTSEDIIQSTNKNEYPTALVIRRNPNGTYQWYGNDQRAYSAPKDNLMELINLATINGLRRI